MRPALTVTALLLIGGPGWAHDGPGVHPDTECWDENQYPAVPDPYQCGWNGNPDDPGSQHRTASHSKRIAIANGYGWPWSATRPTDPTKKPQYCARRPQSDTWCYPPPLRPVTERTDPPTTDPETGTDDNPTDPVDDGDTGGPLSDTPGDAGPAHEHDGLADADHTHDTAHQHAGYASAEDLQTQATRLALFETLLADMYHHAHEAEDGVAENSAALDAEAGTRASADTEIGERIDAEAGTRATADTALDKRIDAEAGTRATADTALDKRIDAEAGTRATADTALDKRIDAEADARATADTGLGKRIAANAVGIETNRVAVGETRETLRLQDDRIRTNTTAIATNERRLDAHSARIGVNTGAIGSLRKELTAVRDGVAAAMAMGQIQATDGIGVGVGVAQYGDSSAYAVGGSYMFRAFGRQMTLSGSGAIAGEEPAVALGANVRF